jgi:hypothetical protein
VSGDDPARVLGGFDEFDWYWIARSPQLYRTIIDCISAAQDLRAGIDRVTVSANDFENYPAAGFIITV